MEYSEFEDFKNNNKQLFNYSSWFVDGNTIDDIDNAMNGLGLLYKNIETITFNDKMACIVLKDSVLITGCDSSEHQYTCLFPR